MTNIGVLSTIRHAFFHDYEVVFAVDACAGTSKREHESSLYDIATFFGDLATSTAIIASLSGAVPLEIQPPVPPLPLATT